MADKGLLESARRMYGAKDAARQEAKKDMLRSGEILYRGLRDFGVAKQREEVMKRSEAARQQAMEVSERRFQETMSFREQQADWQKLKYQENQDNIEYDRIAQNSAVLQAAFGKIQEDPAVLVNNSLNFYKDEISKLDDLIARRQGDPKQQAEQRQTLLNELSTATGQYNTFLDGARQILGMNLSDPNAVPDFDIMSNDPKSLKAKKMWTTVINGMQDGTAKFNFDGGDFTITANFDGKNPSTKKLNESGMLDYNLKNSGKGNELFSIYGNSVDAAVRGTKANSQLLATNYSANLSYDDVVSLSRDYDPNWNGTDTSTFKYNRFIGQDGKRVEMINNTWKDAQNMWWEEKVKENNWEQFYQEENEVADFGAWSDGKGNIYRRELIKSDGNANLTGDQTRADSVWTKNGKPFEWWDDKSWSGENGTGIKLKDAFSNWLGDISADYINEAHYKEKPSQGGRWKPDADLSSVFLGIDKAVTSGNYDGLEGIEILPDLHINNIETVMKDGVEILEVYAGQKVGNDVVQRKIVELNPLTPGMNKLKLFNFVGDLDSGNVFNAPRYSKYNFNVDDKVDETGKEVIPATNPGDGTEEPTIEELNAALTVLDKKIEDDGGFTTATSEAKKNILADIKNIEDADKLKNKHLKRDTELSNRSLERAKEIAQEFKDRRDGVFGTDKNQGWKQPNVGQSRDPEKRYNFAANAAKHQIGLLLKNKNLLEEQRNQIQAILDALEDRN